jgi:hypothetical protein
MGISYFPMKLSANAGFRFSDTSQNFSSFRKKFLVPFCLKERKFCEVSEILNPVFAKNFSCISHREIRKSHPLYKLGTS